MTRTQTNEKPIIFSTEMVQAILNEDKTMSRRTTDLDYINKYPDYWHLERCGMVEGLDGFRSVWSIGDGEGAEQEFIKSPYGKPGDLLYVRETWKPYSWSEDGEDWIIQYKAGGKAYVGCLFESRDKEEEFWIKLSDELSDSGCPIDDSTGMFVEPQKYLNWRPSIFMPKRASCIQLEVTDVRVERVQDITTDDIKAEGVMPNVGPNGNLLWKLGEEYGPVKYLPKGIFADDSDKELTEELVYQVHFASLWDSINADPKPVRRNGSIHHYISYPWANIQEEIEHRNRTWYVVGNPWVWVVSFKLKEVK